MVILRLLACLLPVLLVSSQSLAAGPENPALRCQSQKALAAAKYAECQVRAEGVANDALRAARIARCEDLLKWRFSRAEILAEGQCPTTNDYRSIEAAVALHIRTVNAALDGPPLAAGNCGAGGVPFAYSYMVTNRAAPFATSESHATLEEMVLFRIAQGVSGAFLTPLAQTVLLDSTPPEKHGRAMAMFGMGVVLGPVLGPIIGGWLTENLDWRWVFFVNVPIGLIAMTGLWLLLPEVKRPPRRFDVTGFALLAVALASLQLMLDRGEGRDWFDSVEIWIEMVVAISAFWMFMVHVLTSSTPLFDRTMLRDRNLAIAAVFQGVTGATMVSSMALLPLMLEGLMGYPVFDAGLLLATRGVGMILMMSVVGALMERIAPSILISTGLIVIAMSFWEMSQWSLDVSGMMVGLNGFVQGLGIGLLFVPVSAVAFATLPARYRTDGSVMLNLIRSLGSSAGVSIVLAIFNRNAAVSHSDLVQYVTPYNFIDPTPLGLPGGLSQPVWAAINAEVTRQATIIAFVDDFRFLMIITLCAIPLAFLIRRPREKTKLDIPHVVE